MRVLNIICVFWLFEAAPYIILELFMVFRSLESSSKILSESWSGSRSILVSIKASLILESDVSDGGLDNLEPEELKRVKFALNPGSACITSGA